MREPNDVKNVAFSQKLQKDDEVANDDEDHKHDADGHSKRQLHSKS